MIILADDCMVFQDASGTGVPYSADMISVELSGDSAKLFDPEFLKQAAAAVFHFFRKELGRQTVTMAEFTLALEKVLRGFGVSSAAQPESDGNVPRVVQADLRRLLSESDQGCELLFFPKLRHELRMHLQTSPQMLCFRGIHDCVKQLVGARRWSQRCQLLHDQIVEFLRSCMSAERGGAGCALVVR
jgi:hypothetical protein